MLKGFGNFLLKELKELVRDPKILLGMIIVPLIMFPVLGGIINFSIQSAQEQAQKATLLIINNDGGAWSKSIIDYWNQSLSARVTVVNNTNITDEVATQLLSNYTTAQFIEIPKGFNESMTEYMLNKKAKATLNFYGVFTGGSVFESVGSSIIDNLVYGFNRYVAPDAVNSTKSAIIKGEIKEGIDPAALVNLMTSQAIALPITIMILLTYSMQIAATSVAMEKEEKTLETLLTLPMDRLAILMGKLSSSIIVAAVGALAYMMGYNYMLGSFTASIPAGTGLDLASLGLTPSLFGYLLLGISLFVALLSALALAVIMSAFSEDVRSAQSLIGYIYPFIFIPALALMYLDVNTLPFALRMVLCNSLHTSDHSF
ncbi:ABC transporter permease [Candidatus Bathyarchaeota archaeon]|nr:ABC transporter permease [Candidatus Bathyarchaeota archaeon]